MRLDVALDGFNGCAARRSGEIRWRPEGALVIAASNIRSCLSQHSAGCALQDVNQSRDRRLRRIFDQHVNVIGFTVAGDRPAIHGLADLTEMSSKPVQRGAIEYTAPILCDTDQMYVSSAKRYVCRSYTLAFSLTDQPSWRNDSHIQIPYQGRNGRQASRPAFARLQLHLELFVATSNARRKAAGKLGAPSNRLPPSI